ncbi:DUF4192 domain-containing protein [Streptomonospora nanhaiensis]|uniref:DUF4192 domain-containing protein n=1 Tax=Streptomonospora nanhaiensis TaxID=1323731 RepID=A0A853BTH8_9ACTN|nr:DUF4192 domain-containing protein [Streptomonospora nanhaiensis]MBV2366536.1 DUF4192 domain-containing protein [Streptomonospora nanhaiensis]MBX9388392.1 DUF4192 domain-containing protein [Streptomonospora nanhaiensis]NYI98443.1 hypothetical protein [Streptomonospora nanhaiensis]
MEANRPNPTAPRTPAVLTLTTPADIVAAVPYLLGYHPNDTLVVLGLRGATPRLHTLFRCDLGEHITAHPAEAARHLVTGLRADDCGTALIVGYGPAADITRCVDALRRCAAEAGIAVGEALRVADGRYWSYVCDSPACCPAEGVALDLAASAVSATAVANGLSAWQSLNRIRAYLAPVEGAARAPMRAATRRAERRGRRLRAAAPGRDSFGPRFRVQGARVVRTAIAAALRGDLPRAPDHLAWLGVLLTCVRVRDDAWVRIDPGTADAHVRLWREVLRHVEPGYRPAPGCLLAVAAWTRGDIALADAALDLVRAADPGYPLADLLCQALRAGLPWQGFPAERLDAVRPLDSP